MIRSNGKDHSVPCVWFRTVFCFMGFIQKGMHKNILENSGHDFSDAFHC